MKNLTNYITEKANFIVKKHITGNPYAEYQYGGIMKLLGYKLSDDEIKTLDTITDIFEKWAKEYNVTVDDEERTLASWIKYEEHPIILLIIIAMCLAQDDELDNADLIGMKHYPGKRNPYDCSCFEEETDKGKTILDYITIFIGEKYKEWKRLYDIVDKAKDNISDDPGTLWGDLVNTIR